MSLFNELKRRNVFRVGIAYVIASWLLMQVADLVFPRIGLEDSVVTLVIALLGIGFIPTLIFAWAFEMTSKRSHHPFGPRHPGAGFGGLVPSAAPKKARVTWGVIYIYHLPTTPR